MEKVLVTGSGGYIGRHVVRTLLDMNYTVIAADIHNTEVDDRATKINISIFDDDPDIYKHLGSPDICIHLAWRNGFVHNACTHMEDLSAHCRFLRRMIESGLKNLAVMGTMHEVGYWEGAIDENTPCNPLSQYGVAKNALRQSLMQLTKTQDFNLYWLRAYYILGDDMKNHSVFTKILQKAEEGEKTFPFNSGKNLYDFISVDQLAEYISKAATQKEITGIINVCTGKPVSLADKVEEFIKRKRLSIKLNYGAFPDRSYDSPGVWGNPEKMKKILEMFEGR
ncbi:NAD(P)-dependent oxidoreductase [Blautia liquoris]|uniref:NAD(P)-dependent oxidoreductase n=2 Tax=Blautia liquoris TaxID=2779518 RepID=A0A7M2RNJ0_9FIRM|nr:NAD(P)-dependent oxidoreductase [Blautia liquoris]